jgi:hypothetical protein
MSIRSQLAQLSAILPPTTRSIEMADHRAGFRSIYRGL